MDALSDLGINFNAPLSRRKCRKAIRDAKAR